MKRQLFFVLILAVGLLGTIVGTGAKTPAQVCDSIKTVCSQTGQICLAGKCRPNRTIIASPRRKGKHKLVIEVGSLLYNHVEIYGASGRKWSNAEVSKYHKVVGGKRMFVWPTKADGSLLPLTVVPISKDGTQACPPQDVSSRRKAFMSFGGWKCDTAKSSPGACTKLGLQQSNAVYGTSHSATQSAGKCVPAVKATTQKWNFYVPPAQR